MKRYFHFIIAFVLYMRSERLFILREPTYLSMKEFIASYDVNSLHAKQYVFETRRWVKNEMKLKEIYNSELKI